MANEISKTPTKAQPQIVPLSKIHELPGVFNPKPQDKTLGSMVLSIQNSGVKEAVILRQRDDGEYQLLSGDRRRRASELAKKQDIPAYIYEMTMQEAIAYRKAVKQNPNAPIPGKLIDPSAEKEKGKEGEVPVTPSDKAKDGKKPAAPGDRAKDGEKPTAPGDKPKQDEKPAALGDKPKEGKAPVAPGDKAKESVAPAAPGDKAKEGEKPSAPGDKPKEGEAPVAPGDKPKEVEAPAALGDKFKEGEAPVAPGDKGKQDEKPAAPGDKPKEGEAPAVPDGKAKEGEAPVASGDKAKQGEKPAAPGDKPKEGEAPVVPGGKPKEGDKAKTTPVPKDQPDQTAAPDKGTPPAAAPVVTGPAAKGPAGTTISQVLPERLAPPDETARKDFPAPKGDESIFVVLHPAYLEKSKYNTVSVDTESEDYLELKKSIELNGVKDPVLTRIGDQGTLEIISSQRRHMIATELNYPVPTIIQEISDADAKILVADGNLHRPKISTYDLSRSLRMNVEQQNRGKKNGKILEREQYREKSRKR